MREQLLGEQYRLGVLQVSHAGRGHIAAGDGLVDQGTLQLGQPARDEPGMVAQVQPQVGSDLVVAAAAGPQLAAERAKTLQQTAFQRRVHILVGHRRPERAVRTGPVELVERLEHGR